MCWECTLEEFKPKVADKPVTVYKVLDKFKNKVTGEVELRSPYYSDYPWFKGYKYYSIIEMRLTMRSSINSPVTVLTDIIGTRGLHSFTKEPINNGYHLYIGNKCIPENQRIIKCEIPKDATYAINKRGEVISDTLVMIGVAKIVNGELVYE